MVGMDISTDMDVLTEMQIVMPENSLDKHSEELNKDTKSDGKRQRCDTSANISYVDVMTNAHVSHDDNHWDLLRGVANSLMEECMKENAKIIEEFDVDDVIKVEVDTKEYLRSFSDFYDKGVIMFFTGRIPYLSWIKQWLRNVMNIDCVEDVYAGPRGFYEVVLRSQEYRDQLLNRLPIFYGRSLVHVVPWRPLVEYQDILKQECPVWVEVECNQSTMWPLLCSTIAKLGKVVVPPNANAVNRYRMCILWNTKRKRPGCLHIERAGMPPLYFRLKWGIFAGHCFHCGNLGHFMAECPQKVVEEDTIAPVMVPEDIVNVPNGKQPSMPMTEVIRERQEMQNAEHTSVSEEGGKWVVVSNRMQKGNKSDVDLSSVQRGKQVQTNQAPFTQNRNKNWGRQGDRVLPKRLTFDNKGQMHNPWSKRNPSEKSQGLGEASTSSSIPSHHNSYAILGDFFQDIAEKLALKEKELPGLKGKSTI